MSEFPTNRGTKFTVRPSNTSPNTIVVSVEDVYSGESRRVALIGHRPDGIVRVRTLEEDASTRTVVESPIADLSF